MDASCLRAVGCRAERRRFWHPADNTAPPPLLVESFWSRILSRVEPLLCCYPTYIFSSPGEGALRHGWWSRWRAVRARSIIDWEPWSRMWKECCCLTLWCAGNFDERSLNQCVHFTTFRSLYESYILCSAYPAIQPQLVKHPDTLQSLGRIFGSVQLCVNTLLTVIFVSMFFALYSMRMRHGFTQLSTQLQLTGVCRSA